MNSSLADLTTSAQLLLGAVALIQIVLLVSALWVMLRTPQERLTLPRLAWAAIIVFVNVLGPIAFFLGGRRQGENANVQGASAQTARDAIDGLYQ